ncbi:NAD(P)/FAD-dependent oxidoreductase [Niabella insulamsoli]|uniref:NAD(P)/FAD-dependent oxidoreductase n=1 Tax=Niabella insulamsoli TaxID=3144874 RepID=UPI0031FBC6D5
MQQLSIWELESFYAPQDIVIVGAGFTGLWTAICLKEKYPSKKITVVERGVTAMGASGRNAGFACFGSLTEILSDIKNLGAEKTAQLLLWRFEGLKTIRQYFNDITIDYTNSGGFELLTTDEPLSQLSAVNSLLYDITGSTETFVLKNEMIASFGFEGVSHLMENKFEGALHPGKLLSAMLKKTVALDIQMMYGTEIKSFEENSQGVTLQTAHKQALLAQQVIFCTNAFTKNLLPDLPIVPTRGQILLTEPLPDLKWSGVFHFDEGYYYFRNLNNCVLLGGARNTSIASEYTQDNITTLPIQQALEDFLYKMVLPGQQPKITHRWAGIMATGSEKMPIVKQLSDRTFCGVRLSGMGLALAPSVAKQLAAMV